MPDLSFDEAVQHATQHHGAAYAFVPKGEPPRGGELYMLAYNDMIEDDPDEWPYILWYSAGLFGSSSGEEGSYGPDSIPDEVRSLMFTTAPLFDPSFLDYELQITLKLLQGASLAEARDDSDELRAGYSEG
jgi:hypothetical protein